MAEVERKKGKSFRAVIILLVIGVFILSANLTTIQSSYSKFSIEKTKKVSTITKTLTTIEILHLIDKQYKLSKEYDQRKTAWLYKEIGNGKDSIFYKDYTFMLNHPDYDSAKIEFNVIKYRVNGKTVEFMNKSKIIQVHSKNGWEDK